MKLITKRTIEKECSNLDYELIVWLNEHLKIYLEQSSKEVDLEYYKFTYKRKKYTQKEIIECLIKLTNKIKEDYFLKEDADKLEYYVNTMYDLLKLIHWTLWW